MCTHREVGKGGKGGGAVGGKGSGAVGGKGK